MPRRTTLHPAAPVCREAVELLVARLAQGTALRPRLSEIEAADIEFADGPGEAELCVEWVGEAGGGDVALEEWEVEDEREERAGAGRGALELYERTLEAVSRNPAAARLLAKRLGKISG